MILFYIQGAASRILTTVRKGDQFRCVSGVGDSLSIEQLSCEQLGSLAETSTEVTNRRKSAHSLPPPRVVGAALRAGVWYMRFGRRPATPMTVQGRITLQ